MRIAVLAVVVGVAGTLGVAGAQAPVGGGGRIAFAADRRPNLTHDSRLSFAPRGGPIPKIVASVRSGQELDPSGTRVAYADARGLVVARTDGSNPVRIAGGPLGAEEPVWSPDGRFVAYITVDPSTCGPAGHACATIALWIARADGSGTRKVGDRARYPVWSPDSRRIAFLGGYTVYDDAGRLWVARADASGARQLSDRYGVTHYSWSPRSDRIAFEHKRRLRIVPARGGRGAPVGFGVRSAWSPDGKRLAVVRGPVGGESLWVVTTAGRTLRRVGRAEWIPEIAWSRSGIAYLAVTRRGADSTAARVVDPDGRNARTIVTLDRRTTASRLRWRNGRVELLASAGDTDRDLFTMAPDGSDVRRLTNDAIYEKQPSWAPDGRRIVFESFVPRASAQSSLEVIDASTGGRRRITTPPRRTSDLWPAWSPTGESIAFTRVVAGSPASSIWIVRADGSGAALLTTQVEGQNTHPTWSPDGRRIAFMHSADQHAAIWVMNADGGDLRELASIRAAYPTWSPDGTRFAGLLEGRLVTFRTDGSDLRVLADDPSGLSPPRWSPDGRWLLYETADDLHAVSVDGATVLDLTASPEPETDPDWSGPGG